MIGSVVGQNKSLSAAGKTPKDTSYRTANANKYSAEISSSKRSSKKDPSSHNEVDFKKTGNKIKGSLAGLNNNKSTVLQFDGVGYDNKANQKARYKNNFVPTKDYDFKSKLNINKNFCSIMNNYSSVTTKNSSSDRLSQIVKNNMMF